MDEQVKQELWKMLCNIGKELDLEVGETGVSNGKWIIVQENRITLSIFGRKNEGEKAIMKIKNFLQENEINSKLKKSENEKIFNFILEF